jgi:hypothetical protein
MRPQRIEIGVLLHVGGVVVALLDRLPQCGQGTAGVRLGALFPLAPRELAVTLGQGYAAGQDTGGVVDVIGWIYDRLNQLARRDRSRGMLPRLHENLRETLSVVAEELAIRSIPRVSLQNELVVSQGLFEQVPG